MVAHGFIDTQTHRQSHNHTSHRHCTNSASHTLHTHTNVQTHAHSLRTGTAPTAHTHKRTHKHTRAHTLPRHRHCTNSASHTHKHTQTHTHTHTHTHSLHTGTAPTAHTQNTNANTHTHTHTNTRIPSTQALHQLHAAPGQRVLPRRSRHPHSAAGRNRRAITGLSPSLSQSFRSAQPIIA